MASAALAKTGKSPSDLLREESIQDITAAIVTAFEENGISPIKCLDAIKAAARKVQPLAEWTMKSQRDFDAFPEVFARSYAWAHQYGIEKEAWADAMLAEPSLFLLNFDVVIRNFQRDAEAFKKYGIDEASLAEAAVKYPTSFLSLEAHNRLDLLDRFHLLLAVQEMCGREEVDPKQLLLDHGGLLAQGRSELLLRVVAADSGVDKDLSETGERKAVEDALIHKLLPNNESCNQLVDYQIQSMAPAISELTKSLAQRRILKEGDANVVVLRHGRVRFNQILTQIETAETQPPPENVRTLLTLHKAGVINRGLGEIVQVARQQLG